MPARRIGKSTAPSFSAYVGMRLRYYEWYCADTRRGSLGTWYFAFLEARRFIHLETRQNQPRGGSRSDGFLAECVDETGRCPAGRPWGWRPHYLCGGPSDNLSQRYTRFVRGAGRNAHRLDHISVTDGITGPTTRCPQVAQSSKTRSECCKRVQ